MHAEYEVCIKGGGRSWSKWQRFSRFKMIAECTQGDPDTSAAWKRVLRAKPHYRCLNPDYLAQKCNLLEGVSPRRTRRKKCHMQIVVQEIHDCAGVICASCLFRDLCVMLDRSLDDGGRHRRWLRGGRSVGMMKTFVVFARFHAAVASGRKACCVLSDAFKTKWS